MNVKRVSLYALVLTLLGMSAVRGQAPPAQYEPIRPPGVAFGGEAAPPPTPVPPSAPPPPGGPMPVPRLSDYILGTRPDCCGPIGSCGPIGYEVYLRNGLNLPFGSGPLAKSLDPGWVIQGGGRVLFFNLEQDAAWTIDLSISNVWNHADGEHTVTLHDIIVPGPTSIFGGSTSVMVPDFDVTPRGLNRTYVNLGFGREWWLSAPANGHDWMWRAGFDAGGRYGSDKVLLEEIKHRTDVMGGVFVSLHSDLEIPWGGCMLDLGFRWEWGYTWTDVLQHQNLADVQDINLMLNLGIRF